MGEITYLKMNYISNNSVSQFSLLEPNKGA